MDSGQFEPAQISSGKSARRSDWGHERRAAHWDVVSRAIATVASSDETVNKL